MGHIKKFDDFKVNETIDPNNQDASYEDMDNALASILNGVKSGVISAIDAIAKIKDIVSRSVDNIDTNFPLSGAQS